MTATTVGQATVMWTSGQCEQFTLFAIKGVTSGDTVDLSQWFRNLIQTTWMGATVSGTATGTFNGTVATVPPGLVNAGAYLLVQGVAV